MQGQRVVEVENLSASWADTLRLSNSVPNLHQQQDTASSRNQVCACGNIFMPDALFCRRCGAKRPSEAPAPLGSSGSRGGASWISTPTQSTRGTARASASAIAAAALGVTPPSSPKGPPCAPPMALQAMPELTFASVASSPARVVVQPPVPAPATIAPIPSAVVTDSCQVSAALRAHIDVQVDQRVDQIAFSRVEQACRQIVDRELSNLVGVARREGASASQAAVHQVDQGRQRLEGEVRSIMDAQARLVSLVEGISGDAERFFSGSKSRAEALVTMKNVMTTIDELQRTVEQDGDSSSSKLRQHDSQILELKRALSEDAARHKASIAELQRVQGEASVRQRQCSDELASACGTIAGTRQEVSELAQALQRLEVKLSGWRSEVAADVADEVRAIASARDSEAENERLRLDSMQREIAASSTSRIEVEARLESLRLELSACMAARSDFEARHKETTRSFASRIDSLQAGPLKEIDGLRLEFDSLSQAIQRVEHRSSALRSEVTMEIHAGNAKREQEAKDSLELIRREAAAASGHRAEAEGRIERLQVELTTAIATRDSFEFRIKEGQDELRRLVECFQAKVPEELADLQRRMLQEVRGEVRAMISNERHAIAAIDEQLWLTDQRLGQRIDEIAHAQERNAVLVAVNNSTHAVRAPESKPRSPDSAKVISVEEVHIGTEAWNSGAEKTVRTRAIASAGAASASPTSVANSQETITLRAVDRSPAGGALSDADQLERLRQARRRVAPAGGVSVALSNGGCSELSADDGSGTHGSLSMAHKAGEAFQDLAVGTMTLPGVHSHGRHHPNVQGPSF